MVELNQNRRHSGCDGGLAGQKSSAWIADGFVERVVSWTIHTLVIPRKSEAVERTPTQRYEGDRKKEFALNHNSRQLLLAVIPDLPTAAIFL